MVDLRVIPAKAGIQCTCAEVCLSGYRLSPVLRGTDLAAWVYILASQRNGTLYVGVTSDLVKRVWERKNNVVAGFTRKYEVKQLVYFEEHVSIEEAILREKRIKEWKRSWKLDLIERQNPEWRDRYEEICQ